MLKKISSGETFQHFCDGMNTKHNKIKIYIHDVQAYAMIGNERDTIKYCPYCGVEIDTEERP